MNKQINHQILDEDYERVQKQVLSIMKNLEIDVSHVNSFFTKDLKQYITSIELVTLIIDIEDSFRIEIPTRLYEKEIVLSEIIEFILYGC